VVKRNNIWAGLRIIIAYINIPPALDRASLTPNGPPPAIYQK
jgi:hypothetical protein